MRGTILPNNDINLFLTEEEFTSLLIMEIGQVGGKRKIVFRSLECRLQNGDGSDSGKQLNLQRETFECLGDGIKVEHKGGAYLVRFNSHAEEYLYERKSFGTRYGGGEKIDIHIQG